jgi:SWIM zinc finger
MIALPVIGSEVEVIIDSTHVNKYLHHDLKHVVQSRERIAGKVIPLPSWMTRDADFAIYNYANLRESYIPFNRVISIDGIKVPQNTQRVDKVISVVSSKTGEPYTVRYDGRLNKWSCTCPGFQFRRKCRHVDRESSKE